MKCRVCGRRGECYAIDVQPECTCMVGEDCIVRVQIGPDTDGKTQYVCCDDHQQMIVRGREFWKTRVYRLAWPEKAQVMEMPDPTRLHVLDSLHAAGVVPWVRVN